MGSMVQEVLGNPDMLEHLHFLAFEVSLEVGGGDSLHLQLGVGVGNPHYQSLQRLWPLWT